MNTRLVTHNINVAAVGTVATETIDIGTGFLTGTTYVGWTVGVAVVIVVVIVLVVAVVAFTSDNTREVVVVGSAGGVVDTTSIRDVLRRSIDFENSCQQELSRCILNEEGVTNSKALSCFWELVESIYWGDAFDHRFVYVDTRFLKVLV